MFVVGIDLSGPSNIKDTALVCFEMKSGELKLTGSRIGVGDHGIFELINELQSTSDIIVGIDAPLSYNLGGGDRPGDRRLRNKIRQIGLPAGSVMTPTMTRMVYLTLRGITLATVLRSIAPQRIEIVEVHPGAAMALRGASIESVIEFKSSSSAQKELFEWLETEGLQGVRVLQDSGEHMLAACASALAGWQWHLKNAVWSEPAVLPFHPYDYAC